MPTAITADEINAYLAEAFPISGQRCVEVGGRWAVAAITPDERSRRPGDIISGPTIFGLCDAVLWYALFGAVGLDNGSQMLILFVPPLAACRALATPRFGFFC